MEALDPLETDCFPGGCSWLWKARRHTPGESHAQETVAGPEPQKTTLECDEDGVPWFRRTNTCFEKDGEPFVSHFFTDKDLEGQVYKRGKSHFEDAIGVYPPRTFDRRLTTNIWQSTLAASMLEAGLRLTALMANLALTVEFWSSPDYAQVPWELKIAFAGCFVLGVAVWVILAYITARSYSDFIHPDDQLGTWFAVSSSALLSMFAIPNDIVLLPLHALPASSGGLRHACACVRGNPRWPVHTISHHCKADHDYTNWSGSKVQLPLFVLIDVCCSAIVVYVCFTGVQSFTVLLQMASTFLYAFYRVYEWIYRMRLRPALHKIWRQMSGDDHLPDATRKNVLSKYMAEGGDMGLLQERLRRTEGRGSCSV